MNGAGKRGVNSRREASRGGCLVRLVVLLVALTAAGALAWMLFLPSLVVAQIRARTGFDATVASLSANVFTGRVKIRGLVLTNPATFPAGDFVELREFSAAADVWSLVSERPVLDELTLDVRKVTLLRRADGKSNAELFQQGLGLAGTAGPSPAPAAAPKPAPGPTAKPAFLIRRFALRFDEIVLADYTGAKPAVEEFKLGLDQHYENVTDTKQLLVPEVLRRLAAANLSPTLGALVPGELGRALSEAARDAAHSGADLLKDAGQKANDLFKGLREKLEESRKP